MATDESTSERAVRPVFVVVGVAILAAVLSFVVVNAVFLSDDGGGSTELPTTPADQARPAPTPTPEPVPDAPEDVGLGQGRDPFRVAVGFVPDPTVAPAGAPAQAETTVEVQRVVEDDSFAVVQVGAVTYERARPGDELAAGVTVVGIDNRCVTFAQGEDAFTLCQGESATR